jgi:mono/diheme cytochrome c family protein
MKDNGVTRSTSLLLWVVIVWSLAAPAETAFAQEQDKAKIVKGEQTFSEYCSTCHGDNLISSGQIPDLRRLKATDRTRFESTVINGKNQMPPWKGVVSDDAIDQLWHYIRATAVEK